MTVIPKKKFVYCIEKLNKRWKEWIQYSPTAVHIIDNCKRIDNSGQSKTEKMDISFFS